MLGKSSDPFCYKTSKLKYLFLDIFSETSTTIKTTKPSTTMQTTTITAETTNPGEVEIAEVTTGRRDSAKGPDLPTCDKPKLPQFLTVSCIPNMTSNGKFIIETECKYSCPEGKLFNFVFDLHI